MAYPDDPALVRRGRIWAPPAPFRALFRRTNVIDFPPPRPSRCPELDCVRHRLPRATIERAERRAAELGVGADRVLIAEGAIGEDRYLEALAASLGLDYEVLDDLPREACPLGDDELLDAASAGLLPVVERGQLFWVVAPRNLAARTLTERAGREPRLRLRVTSNAQLDRFVAVYGYRAQGRRAEDDLHSEWPDLSARPGRCRLSMPLAIIALLVPAAFVIAPKATVVAIEAILAAGFVSWLLLRFVGSFIALPPPKPIAIPDRDLPVYTVIVALYREARAVEGLIAALRELDYPVEKLDVKIAIEADDRDTWSRSLGCDLKRRSRSSPSPISGRAPSRKRSTPRCRSHAARSPPSTTPRTGRKPDQLRRVLALFKAGDADLACVQGCLTIDNTADSWLSRLFTAEYAAQFDLFLPGLAALGVPLPLGGSSNHFRTAVLREVGAWDPYNVTEDADLGVRLARFGYRTTMVRSTTYEEAPARFGPWLRQRTRWFKGWMQNLAGAHALSAAAADRTRAARLPVVPAGGRRQRAGGADPPDLPRLRRLWSGIGRTVPRHQRPFHQHAGLALRHVARRRLPRLDPARIARTGAARAVCRAPGCSRSCRSTGCCCRSRRGAPSISSSSIRTAGRRPSTGSPKARGARNGRAARCCARCCAPTNACRAARPPSSERQR